MAVVCCVVFIALRPTTVHAAERTAAPGVYARLLTISAGASPYTRFGHSALHIHAAGAEPPDLVFHYGYGAFDQPAFWLSILRGDAEFFLSANTYDEAMERYEREDRTVVAQRLQLPAPAVLQLRNRWIGMMRAGTNHYVYDHLRDNCATRLRDAIDASSEGALRRSARRADAAGVPPAPFRETMWIAAGRSPLLSLAFELFFGPTLDQRPTHWAAMMLPQTLQTQVAAATLPQGRSLVTERSILRTRTGPEVVASWRGWRNVWLALCLLLVCGPLIATRGRGERTRAVAWLTISMPLAVVSAGIWGLRAIAQSPDLVHNVNALVFLPTLLVLPFASAWWLARGRQPVPWLWRAVAGLHACVALGLLAARAAGVDPQDHTMLLACNALAAAAALFVTQAKATNPPSSSPHTP